LIKITGGNLRSRAIKVIDSENLRPTTSFFREWIFNVLNSRVDIYDLKVVDLFSGSGIIGLEFLSRGSELVNFVEKNNKVLDQIAKNLDNVNIDSTNYYLRQNDATSFLKTFLRDDSFNNDCNLIFLDPPYTNQEQIDNIIELIVETIDDIDKYFIIVLESSIDYKMTDEVKDSFINYFSLIKEKRSGKTKIQIYEKIK